MRCSRSQILCSLSRLEETRNSRIRITYKEADDDALLPKSNVDRLYITRSEGGSGLSSIKDKTEPFEKGAREVHTEEQKATADAARRSGMEVKETVK